MKYSIFLVATLGNKKNNQKSYYRIAPTLLEDLNNI